MQVCVVLRSGDAVTEVRDVDDLGRLDVRLEDVDRTTADTVLREQGLGRIDGDHAWLAVEQLRANGPDNPDWHARFTAMIAYAERHGWVEQGGRRVRAHVASDGPADR